MTETIPPSATPAPGKPGMRVAITRGFLCRCPACGQGRLFDRFLKVRHACASCGTEFHHHRADDFPPYIVMFIVGHLIGYGVLTAETRFEVPMWLHLAVWPALTLVLCLALLQPVKGVVVALQYGLGMHGFGAIATAGPVNARGEPGVGDEAAPGRPSALRA